MDSIRAKSADEIGEYAIEGARVLRIGNILGLVFHSILFLLSIMLVLSTIRYVTSFYTAIDPLGDKKLAVLVFLIGLALVIFVFGYTLRKIGLGIMSVRILNAVEVWIPVFTIVGNILITILNLRYL